MHLNLNRGSFLLLVLFVVFVIPFSHFYEGDHSGLVILQFLCVAAICLEFTIAWQARLSESIPVWMILLLASTYLTFRSHGPLEAILYAFGLGMTGLYLAKIFKRKKVESNQAAHTTPASAPR